jgi:hypothetical protein
MVPNMRENGKMIRQTEREHFGTLMETFLKVRERLQLNGDILRGLRFDF